MRARGFTLIELVVVVVCVSVMTGFALDRLLPLIGRAERAAFLQVRADLGSALLLEAAKHITRGDSAGLTDLARINPMTLLLSAPGNYVGALRSLDPAELPRASWYYDEGSGRLVYTIGRHTRFEPLGGPDDRVEFVVDFVYGDRDGDGVYSPSRDDFDGLRLDPVYAFNWPD